MEDLEREIDRASNKLDPATFCRVFRLARERAWLEPKTEAVAELWNLCNSDDERNLVEDLIKRFRCITTAEFDSIGQQTAESICVVWDLSPSGTLIVATSDTADADGSQAFIQSIKNKFVDFGDWTEANFCNGMSPSLDKLGDCKSIVLVDDFIGTGKQISKRVAWYREKLGEGGLGAVVKLYVIAAAGMEISKQALNSLGVAYFCPVWLKKGISDHYSGADLDQALTNMNSLEARLEPTVQKKSLSIYSFGYNKSETLFAIEPFNVPNNVFPIFWWPQVRVLTRRKTLFKRLAD